MNFKEEEKNQALEAFAELVLDEVNENLEVDGLPPARSESQAEGMADVKAYVKSREAVKRKIVAGFLETIKKMVEIEQQ